MTKMQLVAALRKLNVKHGTRVRFRTFAPLKVHHCSPYADTHTNTVMFPALAAVLDLHVLAHEYAHLLDRNNRSVAGMVSKRMHDVVFENFFYRPVCGDLGIPYEETRQVVKRVKAAMIDEVGEETWRQWTVKEPSITLPG